MKSVVGLTSTILSLFVSIVLAKPIALVLDKLFGWAEPLGGASGGGGVFSSIINNKGMLFLSLIVAVIIFVSLKLTVFFLRRLIDKWREKSKITKRVDSSIGAALGVLKIFVYVCIAFGFLAMLSGIGFVNKFNNWLLSGSHFAKGLYWLAGKIFIPIVKSLGVNIGAGG